MKPSNGAYPERLFHTQGGTIALGLAHVAAHRFQLGRINLEGMAAATRVHGQYVKARRWHKEGRYLIALAHGRTMASAAPFTHWLPMGIGGRIPPLLEADALLFSPHPALG
jgi:hypothetical protein